MSLLSLRELRAIAGLSVRQLAERVGRQDEEIGLLESLEIRLLDIEELVRYCDGLRMPVTITVDVHDEPGGHQDILSTRQKP